MAADASQSGGKLADRLLRWFALRPGLTLALGVLAALGPFLAKPFNFDDPLFLWAARHIQAHPADPYGFAVNWYGLASPMWEVTKNPPLASYYIAFSAMLLGWGEVALHFAFLLPAIAAILGTHRVARRLCKQPALAACATLLTPAFLVSGTTVMCDTLMLAFWVWAVALWVEGMERGQTWRLAVAAGLVALAALTKYFGACLIPLLAGYSLVHQRRVGRWAACLLIPAVSLAAYEWATHALYGKGLLSDAGAYATSYREILGMPRAVNVVVGLAFTGGSLAMAAFLAPFLWRARTLAGFALVAAVLVTGLFITGTISEKYAGLTGVPAKLVEIQVIVWAAGGVGVLGLAVMDAWQRRDAGSFLLVSWVLGTFVFAAFFNWIVNVRSLLPMAPAVGILLARRLEQGGPGGKARQTGLLASLAGGAVLALLVTRADYELAIAVRRSAVQTCVRYRQPRRTLWFEGHWGFQYYMEACGAKAAAATGTVGDFLAVPGNNCNTSPPDDKVAHPEVNLLFVGPRWLTTTGQEVGAGFHASSIGPLPFAFGPAEPESVLVYVLGTPPPYKP